jgi:DNA-binding HxlR family transcriptional regulator
MKRSDFANSPCPIDRSLNVVGDTWTLQILRDAMHGVTRFNDYRSRIGVATNILSARLQKLVNEGIFEVHKSEMGNSHNYILTDKGRDLLLVISALRQWGQQHLFDDSEMINRAIDAKTGLSPKRMMLLAEDGRELSPDDLLVVQSRRCDPIEDATVVDTPRRRSNTNVEKSSLENNKTAFKK